MDIKFLSDYTDEKIAVFVGVKEGKQLTKTAQKYDSLTEGTISRALQSAKFSGKSGQFQDILVPKNTELAHIVLFGLGKDFSAKEAQNLGGKIASFTSAEEISSCTLFMDDDDDGSLAANAGFGFKLGSYKFDKYITKKETEEKASAALTIVTTGASSADQRFEALNAVADGVYLTRDVISEPPNVLYPETMANEAEKLSELGVKVTVLGEAEMAALGMGALLGVGQGSVRESKLAIMEWQGGVPNEAPVAFVGKGVTFDTGGISLKPAGGMDEMKWDMGGSGVVLGVMRALAGRKAKVNAVGVIGLVENMPDGNAQRPGDIVTAMNGQTIEILNTDAEGRLVLADALWYTQDRFKPSVMIDLATLTGAIMVSLGQEHAGLFSNDDEVADALTKAGLETGDKVWRMPMGDAYDKLLKSSVADMKNIGGKYGGSITAAQFLQRFVNDTKWAHLDIAGMAWSAKSTETAPKGATGYGVQLLDRYVADNFETK